MKNFKIVLTVFLSTSLMFIAFGQTKTDVQGTKIKPEFLTKETFKKKVVDYKSGESNDWKYLGDKPCIIDFYADWCRPCRMLSPIVDEIATLYKDQIYVYKIDTQKEQELAALFGINSIPAILFVPIGKQPTMVSGYRDKAQLENEIKQYLLSK
ncbi:MAG: thioredoxin [Prevotellaceae bacterium]|jgi:thioredoxin|nr:thioredoxin [Prevotellaceae bacterium]